MTRRALMAEALRLLQPSWWRVLLASLAGIAGGVATTTLLAIINRMLNDPQADFVSLIWPFTGLCLLAVAGQVMAGMGTNGVGQAVIARLRCDLVARILKAPIGHLERYRQHRLLSTLGLDVDTLSGFTFTVPGLITAVAIAGGCLVYLAALSWPLCAASIVMLGGGSLLGAFGRRRGRRLFEAARRAEDELQRHYRAITDGAKELKVSRPRRLRLFHQDLTAVTGEIARLRVRGLNLMLGVGAINSLLYFGVVGGILAWSRGLPAGADPHVISGFVLVLLYMKGPVQQITGALPVLSRAQVAFARITELSAPVAGEGDDAQLDDSGHQFRPPQTIVLQGVTHHFPASADGQGFTVGPIDLTIRQGEILFITGENGCGKTTLLKLLLHLYRPATGQILVDGVTLTPAQGDDYRQLFSVIFFDYFLFDEVMAADGRDHDPQVVARLLAAFDLDGKVGMRDDRFATTDLSAGQRKRLAMIQAQIEDRPILVFDEWAAEQDPTFRRLFYRDILPDLKRRGKTVIAISHDDRYFDAADHHVMMKDGMIIEARA